MSAGNGCLAEGGTELSKLMWQTTLALFPLLQSPSVNAAIQLHSVQGNDMCQSVAHSTAICIAVDNKHKILHLRRAFPLINFMLELKQQAWDLNVHKTAGPTPPGTFHLAWCASLPLHYRPVSLLCYLSEMDTGSTAVFIMISVAESRCARFDTSAHVAPYVLS